MPPALHNPDLTHGPEIDDLNRQRPVQFDRWSTLRPKPELPERQEGRLKRKNPSIDIFRS